MGKFTIATTPLGSLTPTGTTQGAMLFKINKNDGSMVYYLNFGTMDSITAFVQPNGTSYLYGCGQDQTPTNSHPSYWKINSDGTQQFFRALSSLTTNAM